MDIDRSSAPIKGSSVALPGEAPATVVVEEGDGLATPAASAEITDLVEVETDAGYTLLVESDGATAEVETSVTVIAEEGESAGATVAAPTGVDVSADVLPTRRRFRFPLPRLGRRAAIVMGLFFLLAFSGVSYATYDYDQAYAGKILPGTEIAGVDVGGLTRTDALEAIEGASKIQLDRTIQVTWKNRTWTVTPRKLGAKSNATALVDEALSTSENTNVFKKAGMAVLGNGLSFQRDLAITYPRQGVRGFVEGVASTLDREPVEASIDYSTGWVELEPAKDGLKVLTKQSRRVLHKALRTGSSTVELAVKTRPAATDPNEFDQILLLRIGENKLYFYQDGKITHSWTVATGLPEYPTPTGLYEITEKRYMPTWVNPDPTGWGASMPAMIPPGPGNPLGTRALNWSASGIRFHGTEATYSLGYNASHGCVRMAMADVELLYDMVDVGTPIVSVWASPSDPLYTEAPDPTVVEADAGTEAPATEG